MLSVASGEQDAAAYGELQSGGDASKLATLFGLLETPDPDFAIVTA
ncbi:MAG TPA: alkyl sulfatase C-terminal domain-containing protein [Conexibacter sp.]|nr:alkyl sulfatase C-terminal domain-containing protein [Conexibacter sp.]